MKIYSSYNKLALREVSKGPCGWSFVSSMIFICSCEVYLNSQNITRGLANSLKIYRNKFYVNKFYIDLATNTSRFARYKG